MSGSEQTANVTKEPTPKQTMRAHTKNLGKQINTHAYEDRTQRQLRTAKDPPKTHTANSPFV